MQLSLYLDDELTEKINQRLPRNIKIAVISRWLLRAIVLTPKELEEICRENDDEARIVAPYLQGALSKLFEVGKEASRQ